MTKQLEGKVVGDALLRELGKETEKIPSDEVHPKLIMLRVGNKGDDIFWEKSLKKAGSDRGIETETVVFPWDIAKEEFLANIKMICQRDNIHGVLPFLPFTLPDYMSWESEIRGLIPPEKDVACTSLTSNAHFYLNDFSGFLPPMAQAVVTVLKHHDVPLDGANVGVVEGDSPSGKPLSALLLKEKATVTICSCHSENLEEALSRCDIIITAADRANFLTQEYVREGQVIVDAGVNKTEDGYCGDIDIAAIGEKAGAVVPFTAGVTYVKTAIILNNVFLAYKHLQQG